MTNEGYKFQSPSQSSQSNDDQDILNRQVVDFSKYRFHNPQIVRTENPPYITENTNETPDEIKVINLPQYKPLPERTNQTLAAIQEWEGVVTAVKDNLIYANMVDITVGNEMIDEVAEIPLSEISESDQSRVVPGAIFRWAIGYLRTASGVKMNSSIIYFRRTNNTPSSSERIPPLVFETDD